MPKWRSFPRLHPVLLALLLGGLLSACATAFPDTGRQVALDSHDVFFPGGFESLQETSERDITARVILPDPAKFDPPFPAMVLVHTASGRTVHEWRYAQMFLERGIAVLAPDSFAPRGVERTSKDESLVTEASMIADAFSGLEYLAEKPEIDADRIGIMGTSKGGVPAIFTAMQEVRQRFGVDEARFAVHIAYYPWCAVELLDMRTTGAPIMVQVGEADTVTPADACRKLESLVTVQDPDADFRLYVHKGAHHAFDHPYAGNFFLNRFEKGFPIPTQCYFREVSPGRFVEDYSGLTMTPETLPKALQACSTRTALVIGDEEVAEKAHRLMMDLVEETLLAPDSPRYHADADAESASSPEEEDGQAPTPPQP